MTRPDSDHATSPSLLAYRAQLLKRGLSPSTINVQLSAIRQLVAEARRNGILDSETAASIANVPNVRQQGTRMGNWLNRDQAKKLLAVPDQEKLIGKRDHALEECPGTSAALMNPHRFTTTLDLIDRPSGSARAGRKTVRLSCH